DVVTLGKALGNGVPVSAVVAPARLLEAPTASALMTTVGNPVSCAAARAVLGVLRDGALADQARTLGLRAVELLRRYTQ
ncbi:aminotransferase class III-fold pyridoxal phosphate-dependent enzyme, partial [Salmonella enterica subsp. enterica serovar Typhimurium]|uniref:aminotransferase class III-fold pyridoxal phosphate-dependent enzyme n=2 Tax=Bacteria TaxID=2 RepID=UPI0015C97B3A